MYTPLKWDHCPLETPMKIYLNMPESFTHSLTVSGHATVSEDIAGELDFVIENSRCTLDMKTCSNEGVVNIRDMCKKVKKTDEFYSPMFMAMQPRMDCPLQAGNYTLPPVTLDLKFARLFPVEGYIFTTTYKVVASNKKMKTKRTAGCLTMELKIVGVNRRNKT